MTAEPILLSFSQCNTMLTCGWAAWLEKECGVQGAPHWSTLGGSAFHALTEAMVKQQHGMEVVIPTVSEALDAAVADELARPGQSYAIEDFRASKSALGLSAKVSDRADRAYLEDQIPVWLDRWREFNANSGYEYLLFPSVDGGPIPGIEVPFEFEAGELDGRPIVMRGFMDAVRFKPQTGTVLVEDSKAGANQPNSPMQLALYRYALKRCYGIEVNFGYFYLARKGIASAIYNLATYTDEMVEWWVKGFARRKLNQDYAPNRDSCVKKCGLMAHCIFYGGEKADPRKVPWRAEDKD